MILKGNFKYGVSSLKKNEILFYSQLFKLLNEKGIENFLFSISKMSLVIDSRLNDWILDCSTNFNQSALLLKYVLAKYASIEASENVIESLFDKNSTNVDKVLHDIKKDLENIVKQNINNPRMHRQIKIYKDIIDLINLTKKCKKNRT